MQVNPAGRHNAIAVTIGLLLLAGILVALLAIPRLGSAAAEGTLTSASTWATTAEPNSHETTADLDPIDVDTEAAFDIVRGSSVNDDPVSAAADFLNGQLHVGRYGARPVSEGVDWSGDGESRSYLRLLHGQFILNDLAKAYSETGDEDYLKAAYFHIQSWEATNPIDDPASNMAWHDETTARRLVNWLGLLAASRNYSDQEAVNVLWASAAEHAALLATDDFHATGTNHGMFQDQSLLAYAAVSLQADATPLYLELARDRLLTYFDATVSADGVHLEHSPSYHQTIISSIKRYARYFDLIGDSATSRHLSTIVAGMSTYATYVIQPDCSLPLIGDTFSSATPRTGLFEDDQYLYARTAGEQGERPSSPDAVFPEAGYAILRDSWSTGGEGTYVHFTAAYHGSYHKHSDDLSVWLYHDGELLTESGPNGYDYDDPITQFAYSSAAHNTLLVDGEGLPRVDGNFDGTYLESYDFGDEISSATGVTTRYEGIRHTRTVSLNRSTTTLTVIDRIDTDRAHRFTLLWHVAPDIEAEITATGVVLLSRSGTLVARISVESVDANPTTRLATDDPDFVRSLRLGGGSPDPTSVIVVEFQADGRVELTTSIELLR